MRTQELLATATPLGHADFAPLEPGKATLTRVGAQFPENLAQEEWRAFWPKLRWAGSALKFIRGDWLNFGADHYIDQDGVSAARRVGKYAAVLAASDEEYQTLANEAWICRAVPLPRRRTELFFTHHAEVAGLPPAEQTEWLGEAALKAWSTAELRRQLRAARAQRDEPLLPPSGFIAGVWAQEGLRHLTVPSVSKWSPGARAALHEVLERLLPRLEELLTYTTPRKAR